MGFMDVFNFSRTGRWLALVAGFTLFAVPGWAQTPDSAAAPAGNDQVLTRYTFRNVAKSVMPAVVNIRIKSNITLGRTAERMPQDMQELLDRLLERERWNQRPGERRTQRYARTGSGVIVRSDGYLVTSEHVVRDVDEDDIEISTSDGRIFRDVEVVGTDVLTDLAVIKINDTDTTNVPHLEWADSDEAQVGDHVLAIGNPLEFTNSVSQGIISAKHRTINKAALEDLLQTTAMINPGNSGGALVDLDGRLVGINMAIATSTGMWSGLGFAIPSNTARLVTDQIISKGKALRGYLGIVMGQLTVGLARQLGYENDYGIVVADVAPGTAAERAGIQHYDIIASVNGNRIEQEADMHQNIGNLPVGTTVTLEIWRDEGDGKLKQTNLDVVLGERPDDQSLSTGVRGRGSRPALPGTRPDEDLLGLKLKPQDDGKGLVVEEVNPRNSTQEADLRVGDVVLQVNRQPVTTLSEFREALRASNTGSHLLQIERNGTAMLQMVPGD